MMRVAIDTNVMLYIHGLNDAARQSRARAILHGLRHQDLVIAAQSMGELFRALVKKGRWSPDEARKAMANWMGEHEIGETTGQVLLAAADLAADHQFHIFDAIVLATAVVEGCRLLLSEDLQNGFTWAGVTVVDPFAATPHPLLEAALRPRS